MKDISLMHSFSLYRAFILYEHQRKANFRNWAKEVSSFFTYLEVSLELFSFYEASDFTRKLYTFKNYRDTTTARPS